MVRPFAAFGHRCEGSSGTSREDGGDGLRSPLRFGIKAVKRDHNPSKTISRGRDVAGRSVGQRAQQLHTATLATISAGDRGCSGGTQDRSRRCWVGGQRPTTQALGLRIRLAREMRDVFVGRKSGRFFVLAGMVICVAFQKRWSRSKSSGAVGSIVGSWSRFLVFSRPAE